MKITSLYIFSTTQLVKMFVNCISGEAVVKSENNPEDVIVMSSELFVLACVWRLHIFNRLLLQSEGVEAYRPGREV